MTNGVSVFTLRGNHGFYLSTTDTVFRLLAVRSAASNTAVAQRQRDQATPATVYRSSRGTPMDNYKYRK